MKTLSQKYANKDTRDGIAVNKTYLVPFDQLYLEPGYNVRGVDLSVIESCRYMQGYIADCIRLSGIEIAWSAWQESKKPP